MLGAPPIESYGYVLYNYILYNYVICNCIYIIGESYGYILYNYILYKYVVCNHILNLLYYPMLGKPLFMEIVIV